MKDAEQPIHHTAGKQKPTDERNPLGFTDSQLAALVGPVDAIGKDVKRLADAAEQLVALAKAEIARTSR